MRKLDLRSAVALAAATIAAAPAAAQNEMPVTPLSPSWLSGQLIQSQLGRHDRSAPPKGAARSAARASTTYRRDPAVTHVVVAKVSAWAERTAGLQAAGQMHAALARTDLEPAWASLTAPHGFRTGDGADSLAAYWALNWSMANGRPADERQMAGARAQVHAMMAANPTFVRMDDAGRQAVSETFMLNYILQHDAYADALRRGDRALLQRLSDTAEQRFRTEMRLDLRGLDLTDRGFRQRS